MWLGRLVLLSWTAWAGVGAVVCGIDIPPPPCSDGAKLPAPWHSGQYIVCRGSSGYLRHCGQGEYFDPKIEACKPGAPEARPCGGDGSLEHTKYELLSKLANRLTNSLLAELTVDEIKKHIDSDLQKELKNIEALRLKESSRADNISERCRNNSVTAVRCPAESPDSLLPHPDDCGLFYYCVRPDLPPVCRDCPAGLHFNPTEHVCDDPAAAGCRAGASSTTDTTEANNPTAVW